MTKRTWSVILLVMVTVVWGATFVVVQDATKTMAIFSFLWWRFGIAALALAIVRPQTLVRLTATDWRRGAVLGLFLALGYSAQTIGLQFTSATVAGFITGMFVVLTPLLAAVIFRRKIGPAVWLAVFLAVVGLGLLSLNGFAIGGGELIVLLGAVGFAAHLVYLSEWTSITKAYGLTIVQLAVVALVSAVLALPTGGLALPQGGSEWWPILFLALVATAGAYLVQTWAQADLSATRTAIILTLEPVFAGVFGVLLAGDIVTWRTAIGALLILGAMYLVESSPTDRKLAGQQGPHP